MDGAKRFESMPKYLPKCIDLDKDCNERFETDCIAMTSDEVCDKMLEKLVRDQVMRRLSDV